MALGARPRMAGYWKFNLSFLDRQDFRQQLIRLVQQELMVGRLKDSIRSFTTEYSQQLILDKAKKEKALKDSLS